MKTETKIIARYAETDQMGMVHHSVYPIWYEAARTDFSNKCGFPYKKMEEIGILTPIVEVYSKYFRSAYYDEEITVTTRISKLTPARVEFSYEVFGPNDEKPINIGRTLHGLVGKDLRPINTKKLFPEIYSLMEKTMEE